MSTEIIENVEKSDTSKNDYECLIEEQGKRKIIEIEENEEENDAKKQKIEENLEKLSNTLPEDDSEKVITSENDDENLTRQAEQINLVEETLEKNVDQEEKKESEETPNDSSQKLSSTSSDLLASSSLNTEVVNNLETDKGHSEVVASHYNALEEKGLSQRRESSILHMRNFNNWIKSMLINEYLEKIKENKKHREPVRVLDMCCGKGGDLLKWKRANITHLICADIAEVSVEQCKSRYEGIGNNGREPVFTAEFLSYDCTKVRLREKYRDPSMELDLVSCQFAFHYSFESLPQAECMLKNASESLRPGGYFIGTMPNAKELVWQKSDSNKIGNDIYNIEFQCDKDNVPLFGAKYHFYLKEVVDCPEFLVHLPTLCKLATKYGLYLEMFEPFKDFFMRKKDDREGKTLLHRMTALETYPLDQESQMLTKDFLEYRHAQEHLQTSGDRRKVGTLRKTDWEAISLYAVFAFRKGTTKWNAEGKPEFVKFSK